MNIDEKYSILQNLKGDLLEDLLTFIKDTNSGLVAVDDLFEEIIEIDYLIDKIEEVRSSCAGLDLNWEDEIKDLIHDAQHCGRT